MQDVQCRFYNILIEDLEQRYNTVQITLLIHFSPNLDACSLKPDEGTGFDPVVYMYYDEEKDSCFPFRYYGEGGNANRFIIEKQCMRNCSRRAEELFPRDGNLSSHIRLQ